MSLALSLGAQTGCSRTQTETIESGLSVRYLAACKPRRVERITLEALGDFATTEGNFASIDVASGAQDVSALPIDARLFRLEVKTSDFDGVSIARADDDGKSFDALVLPRGEPCLSVDDASLLRSESALALTSDSDLLVAGGKGKDAVTNLVQRVRLDQGKVTRVNPGLFVARAGAAAVRVGDETWILGGAQSESEATPAFDSFERYSATGNSLSSLGRLSTPRSHACALTLPDQSVLVLGGQSSVGGRALDSIERIVPGSEQGRVLEATLPFALSSGRCFLRDDGFVAVVEQGTQRISWALFDPASESVEELDAPSERTRSELVVALPGSRMAFFETDEAGVTTGALFVRLAQGELVRVEGALTSFSGLSAGRALSLHDGQVLLTGERDGRATARLINPGTGSVRAVSLDATPAELLLRDDGVVVMVTDAGVTLLRQDDRTLYDNPGGTLLSNDNTVVALDAPDRFSRDGLVLRAEDSGARFDLAGLSYDRVTIEIDTQGEVEVLLRLENGPERAISLGKKLGPALCTLERSEPGAVTLRRDGTTVAIENGSDRQTCKLDGFDGRIRVGVRALEAGAEVRALLVSRPD